MDIDHYIAQAEAAEAEFESYSESYIAGTLTRAALEGAFHRLDEAMQQLKAAERRQAQINL